MTQNPSEFAKRLPNFGSNQVLVNLRKLLDPKAIEVVVLRLCLALIALVSVHDATLIVVNHEVMMEFEENPVGLWLLQMQGGDVWVFVAAKLLGTSIVVTVISELFRSRRALSLTCAIALAAFQFVLLGYLTLG